MKLIVHIILLLAATLLIIAVFGRKKRSEAAKWLLLLVADGFFVAAILIYAPEPTVNATLRMFFIIMNILAVRRITLGEDPNQDKYNQWHDDPRNWKAGVFYYNPDDKRLLPPKRVEGMGWTINFANPYSILVLVAIIVAVYLIGLVFTH